MSEATTKPQATVVLRTREPARWCFGCRARHGGTHKLHEDASGYRDRFWTYECDGCGSDHRCMFGHERPPAPLDRSPGTR